VIAVDQVSRRFGSRTALESVTFNVAPGESVMLTGRNGSGKSTLFRILAGFLPASSGYVRVAGYDLLNESLELRAAIGYVPENAPLYPDMRTTEYLRFRGRLRHLSGRPLRARIDAVVEACRLIPLRHQLIGTLSQGQRVQVALADALLHEPPLLLLDDPLAVLDCVQRSEFVDMLQQVRGESALLISTNFPDEVLPLCSRLLLLGGGRLIRDVPAQGQAVRLQAKVAEWLAESDSATASKPKGAS